MKRIQLLSLAALLFMIAACSSSKDITGIWVNKEKIQGKQYNNIFIVVMTDNIDARSKIETDLAAAATQNGFKSVKSIDVMSPTLNNSQTPTKEEIVSKVKASGCDAVFVASLLRKEDETRYIPGSRVYSPMPYYSSWGGNYYGYYRNYYPTLYTPGYYTNDKNYFMQSNLYDAASEELMWSVQSTIFNPSSLKGFSKSFTKGLIKKLEKEGLLKK